VKETGEGDEVGDIETEGGAADSRLGDSLVGGPGAGCATHAVVISSPRLTEATVAWRRGTHRPYSQRHMRINGQAWSGGRQVR
jgi:hypothetical protein